MTRIIRSFDKKSERLVAECELKGISLRELQSIFGVHENDPMYDGLVREKWRDFC